MSNWSSVIMCWSSSDGLGVAKEHPSDHPYRFKAVIGAFREDGPRWTPILPCGPWSLGSACEFVAVAHVNHFCVDELMEVLDKYVWESPEEVQVMCKDEEQDQYFVLDLAEWRKSHKAGYEENPDMYSTRNVLARMRRDG